MNNDKNIFKREKNGGIKIWRGQKVYQKNFSTITDIKEIGKITAGQE